MFYRNKHVKIHVNILRRATVNQDTPFPSIPQVKGVFTQLPVNFKKTAPKTNILSRFISPAKTKFSYLMIIPILQIER